MLEFDANLVTAAREILALSTGNSAKCESGHTHNASHPHARFLKIIAKLCGRFPRKPVLKFDKLLLRSVREHLIDAVVSFASVITKILFENILCAVSPFN